MRPVGSRVHSQAGGVEYMRSALTRSELYLEGLPLFSRGLVSIPDNATLLRELRLLERRTARSGKDSVDHGVGGSDDFANSLFGALHLMAKPQQKMCKGLGLVGAFRAPRASFGSLNSEHAAYLCGAGLRR